MCSRVRGCGHTNYIISSHCTAVALHTYGSPHLQRKASPQICAALAGLLYRPDKRRAISGLADTRVVYSNLSFAWKIYLFDDHLTSKPSWIRGRLGRLVGTACSAAERQKSLQVFRVLTALLASLCLQRIAVIRARRGLQRYVPGTC